MVNGLSYGAGSPTWLTQTVVAVIAVLISGVMTIIIGLALTYTMGWRIPAGARGPWASTAARMVRPPTTTSNVRRGSGASGVLTGSRPKDG